MNATVSFSLDAPELPTGAFSDVDEPREVRRHTRRTVARGEA
jgi:hypothetical protein